MPQGAPGTTTVPNATKPPVTPGQEPTKVTTPPPGQEPGSKAAGESDPGQAPGTQMSQADAQAAIKALREENAKHRLTNKELGEKMAKMETGLKNLFGSNEAEQAGSVEEKLAKIEADVKAEREARQALEEEKALNDLAKDLKIPDEGRDFFNFLLQKELNGLNEGEELSDEALEDVAKKAKAQAAPASTSVENGGKGSTPPPSGNAGETTLEEFATMSMGQKSELYGKDPNLYNKLLSQAKIQGKLV